MRPPRTRREIAPARIERGEIGGRAAPRRQAGSSRRAAHAAAAGPSRQGRGSTCLSRTPPTRGGAAASDVEGMPASAQPASPPAAKISDKSREGNTGMARPYPPPANSAAARRRGRPTEIEPRRIGQGRGERVLKAARDCIEPISSTAMQQTGCGEMLRPRRLLSLPGGASRRAVPAASVTDHGVSRRAKRKPACPPEIGRPRPEPRSRGRGVRQRAVRRDAGAAGPVTAATRGSAASNPARRAAVRPAAKVQHRRRRPPDDRPRAALRRQGK